MNLMRKVVTALRGQHHEQVEAWVDRQALGIFAQEIRDAERALAQAREGLTLRVAERRGLERQLADNIKRQESVDGDARASLERKQAAWAQTLAAKMVDLQDEAEALTTAIEGARQRELQTAEHLRSAAAQVRQYHLRLARARCAASSTGGPDGRPGPFPAATQLQNALQELRQTSARLDQQVDLADDHDEAARETEGLLHPEQASRQALTRARREAAARSWMDRWQATESSSSTHGNPADPA